MLVLRPQPFVVILVQVSSNSIHCTPDVNHREYVQLEVLSFCFSPVLQPLGWYSRLIGKTFPYLRFQEKTGDEEWGTDGTPSSTSKSLNNGFIPESTWGEAVTKSYTYSYW